MNIVETELTKIIKKKVRSFKPHMGNMRTIRYAEEVWTPTGIVDVIRFEDYVIRDDSYCFRISEGGRCKLDSEESLESHKYPSKECHGCVHKRSLPVLSDIPIVSCYEIKISEKDFHSSNGHNFCGNENYYVVPVDIVDKISSDVPNYVGIIAYYPDSQRMRVIKSCSYVNISKDIIIKLYHNALKKWVDKYSDKE